MHLTPTYADRSNVSLDHFLATIRGSVGDEGVVDHGLGRMGARHPCIGVARIHSFFSARTASALGAVSAVHLTGPG